VNQGPLAGALVSAILRAVIWHLLSVTSLCEIEADHWAQIGWFTTSDAAPIYAMIAQDLANQGL